ncbi:putative ribonuclease H protein, partial [Camellia lanceoleosa]
VKVRLGGGRDMVLSFQSAADKKDKLVRMKDWLNEWCESVLEWRQVPLNLWSYNTFSNIGKNWGVVIGIDDDTLQLNSLQSYDRRVSQSNQWKDGEKCSSVEAKDEPILNKNSRHEEDEDDVEVQVNEALRSWCDVAGVVPILSPTAEAELDGEDSSKHRDDGVGRGVDGNIYTPGFMKSISGSAGNRAGIHLEVDLNRAQTSPGLNGGIGRPEKMRKLKKYLAERKVDIVLLQETKRSEIDSIMVRSMWPGDKFEFMSVDAIGRAGGLLFNGVMIEDPMELRAEVQAHFTRLFSEAQAVRPKLSGPFLSIGGTQAMAQLEAEFSEEEIKYLDIIKGAEVGSNGLRGTHLQFADDTILFCEATRREVSNIKSILSCFEISSGLKINYHKSIICGIGVEDGLRSTWKPVLDKFKQKLASWKRRLLSFAGRLTLIKSVMSNLPIYYLSLFRIPTGVAKEIERMQSSFLWGGSDLRRKIHMVRWDVVTKNKNLDPSEVFSVASAYKWSESFARAVKGVGRLNLEQFRPSKVQFFGWWSTLLMTWSLICLKSSIVSELKGEHGCLVWSTTYIHGSGIRKLIYKDISNHPQNKCWWRPD